uniref:Uncharacterized protein n=1 Tax=Steinernema glaseri TaxID=37863 RepID=A0A1I7YNW3_9BILA
MLRPPEPDLGPSTVYSVTTRTRSLPAYPPHSTQFLHNRMQGSSSVDYDGDPSDDEAFPIPINSRSVDTSLWNTEEGHML